MEKKTALYERHVAAGGKLVPFAGYLLPIQYGAGLVAEHMAVRERAGLFDVSHMGEVFVEGKDALTWLNRLLTNDFGGMEIGQVRYSLMLNEAGGTLDDLLVTRLAEGRYMVVLNASNREKDVRWMREHLEGEVSLEDRSDDIALLALQGPEAPAILKTVADAAALPKGYYRAAENVLVAGIRALVSRTGYTGELGYELACDINDAPALWDALMEAGAERGLVPCGLGARDTLRLEAAMPLYGHELDETVTPIEAGLGFAVKMQKDDFVGKAALLAGGEPPRVRVGLKVTGRGILREGAELTLAGRRVGAVTSGTHCPFLGYAAAMALVERGAAAAGEALEADVRGRRVQAEVVPLPFYSRPRA